VSEENPLHPESPYAETKRMAEQMLRWFDINHGIRYASLRYFNAAGAVPDGSIGEDPSFTLNLIPLVMKAATGKAPSVKVFGTDYPTPDGTAIRDYIHVLDLADAHIKALEYLARRPGDPVAVWADNTKARTLLGWEPQYDLEDIIRTAWRWHSTHPDGYVDS
jgi:UDP-glucose 4-epimerase